MNLDDEKFMKRAIEVAKNGITNNIGGPFGAVIVKDGKIIAESSNRVTSENDPTAHAEVEAIRMACKKLETFQLDGCTLYTSCEPCPMCLGAIYWARFDKVYYACNKSDAAKIDFDDKFIYDEINVKMNERKIPFQQIMRKDAIPVFEMWDNMNNKIEY